MKLIFFSLALFIALTGYVVAGEIIVTAEKVDGNTVITCTPTEAGSIDKAYITLYEESLRITERSNMDISVDNKATYLLPGEHSKVEGRCRLFMLKKSGISIMPSREKAEREVLRERFSLNVK